MILALFMLIGILLVLPIMILTIAEVIVYAIVYYTCYFIGGIIKLIVNSFRF